MAAFPRQNLSSQDLNRWIAPAGAAVGGLAILGAFALMPVGSLENLVWRSGIAALLPVAAPPLGATARAILALGGGMFGALVLWSALFLLFGPGGFVAPSAKPAAADVPVLRKADAHPDNPPRKPMSARDLGTPMPPVMLSMEQAIPVDLDQPLAAFDPGAMPDVPLEPVRPVAPLRLAPALQKGERMASVELPRVPSNDDNAPSIESLLRRLEQGTRQRAVAH